MLHFHVQGLLKVITRVNKTILFDFYGHCNSDIVIFDGYFVDKILKHEFSQEEIK